MSCCLFHLAISYLFLCVLLPFVLVKVQQRATQDQIAYFGQTPSQLLTVPHLKKMPLADVLHLQVTIIFIWLNVNVLRSDTFLDLSRYAHRHMLWHGLFVKLNFSIAFYICLLDFCCASFYILLVVLYRLVI